MKKLMAALVVLTGFSATAQTLFHYGKDSVSANEFLRAWHKNNTGEKTPKAFSDYLDLYIASRLKIAEAKRRGYDTLPQLVSDLENLRQQILPSYATDKESVNRLVDEALVRSGKDVHLAHIFIGSRGTDAAAADKRFREVQAALLRVQAKGAAGFAEVARMYSDDPAAKTNGGDMGWITAFSLPYDLENLAYTTAPGSTQVYQSRAGYHIFRNLGERKALGRIKAAQILLAFPPGATEGDKALIKKRADSLYNRLLKGDDFGKLATQFSNDVISAAANGQMPEFGVGQYDALFESTAFSLPKDGAISKPFATGHGYHIVKRLGKVSLPLSPKDTKAFQALRDRVEGSDRMASSRAALAQKILQTPAYRKEGFAEGELWSYSDSVLNYQAPKTALHLTTTSPLFSLEEKKVTVADWISYAQNFRYKTDGSGYKSYPQVWDEFREAMALDYYQNHLENFNEEFRQQINEFRDGNLFFEIMQRQVWGPAQTDTAALLQYYGKHRSKYTWTKSADAVIFYAADGAAAKVFTNALQKAPARWQTLAGNMSEKIAADSGRFELAQIPNGSKGVLKAGTITEPVINKGDNTATFAYIVRTYTEPQPRSFAEAKGLVISDYQNELEKEWLEELKKKYPVTINPNVLNNLVQNGKW